MVHRSFDSRKRNCLICITDGTHRLDSLNQLRQLFKGGEVFPSLCQHEILLKCTAAR
jgi:hypothetical protein